jgi:outer membrane protein OmpA-like peptidoglycan-associated protein
MIQSKHPFIWTIALPIALALAASGCATKKYVRNQVSPVNAKVDKYKHDTDQKVAAVWNKETNDISQVNERISTTDQKVAQVEQVANNAQGTASRAMDATETNSAKIAENASAISTLGSGVANALNYQLVEKEDVMFGFNKSTLTPTARKTLDELIAKSQTLPRSVIELAGFTDTVGTRTYNLALSRRRAEAVQRYLVMQKVPLRNIHIVGLGEAKPPEDMAPESTSGNRRQMERRVQIRLFGAGDITGSASRVEP